MTDKISKDGVILCVSGGIDSMIAWYMLHFPQCVFFDMGTKVSDKEWNAVEKITQHRSKIHIETSLSLPFDQNHPYVLHRNLLLAAIAAQYGNDIYIAGLRDDKVPDKNPGAFQIMSETLTKTSNESFEVMSPLWGYTKTEAVKWLLENHPHEAENVIKNSYSCYSGEIKECGKCNCCFRKACALFNAGCEWNFTNTELVNEYRQRAINREYILDRCLDIILFAEEFNKRNN